ncbi:MAG TPA: sulfurtransferase TusA family protein [Limnochordales bacterium]
MQEPVQGSAAQQVATRVVDARGSFCPGPLMELIKAIKSEPVGAVVEVWSSDQGSRKDIPEWVQRAGHELLYIQQEAGYWRIAVRKAR